MHFLIFLCARKFTSYNIVLRAKPFAVTTGYANQQHFTRYGNIYAPDNSQ